MSILNFPTLSQAPYSCKFVLMPNTQRFESPLNRTVQTLELPGARWKLTLEYKNISEVDARTFKAFLAKARGMAGRFYCWDWSHQSPFGTALGSGTVSGSGQTGSTLLTHNWTPSQTNLLNAGDYFQVNGEVKIITEVAQANGSGVATLTFEPPLRNSPPDDTVIVTYRPSCTFKLVDDEQDQITFDPDRVPSIKIEAAEVF